MSKYLDRLLENWHCPEKVLSLVDWKNTPHWRLLKAYHDGNFGEGDWVSLFRAMLRFEELQHPYQDSFTLENSLFQDIVPENSGFWVKASIFVHSSKFQVLPWNPKWLPGAQEESPETALLKAKKVREDQKFPGDPFLLSLGLDSYYSKAQRDAIHACLCAPNGHTLLLNLPTGSGKSLCAFVPALLPIPGEYEILGVAPIIVPTVSLALDLAKKLEEWVGHPVVYRPDAPTEQIEEMKGRCENGTQGPLILSPEAFVGKTFQPSLQEAAKKAYLKYLIVDEAHMVLNWGDEFRPEFQRLAPIRKKLLELSKKSPFKTILMSATLTEYHIHWLKMFSEGDRWFMVHAVRLRPEPIYWQASANVEEERQSWILESLFHLPRPIILYCTQQETCNKWFDILRRNGFQRIGKIHGKTKEKERLEEMEKWNQDEIDLMVATSAFGLGVDKPNVRGVVHAELPESMDRFYQDVGRGEEMVALPYPYWFTTKKDWEIVHYLTPSLIGMDKGLDRWKSLFEKKKEVKGKANIYLLNLDTEPKLDMGNKQNRLWNLRTLLLMERAKMISLTFSENCQSNWVEVHPLVSGHQNEGLWQERFEPFRELLMESYSNQRKLLQKFVRFEYDCLSELFLECYQSKEFGVIVTRSCGGMSFMSREKRSSRQGRLTTRYFPQKEVFPSRGLGESLQRFVGSRYLGGIYYSSENSKEIQQDRLLEVFLWFYQQGVINFLVSPQFKHVVEEQLEIQREMHFLFFHNQYPKSLSALQPTAIFVEEPEPDWWEGAWEKLQQPVNSFHFLVAPLELKAPDHGQRLVYDILPASKITLQNWEEDFLE